ncbi:MAG: hypothetical protein KGL99_14555 [Burkholderiales bacterium]|nr:hypothetical protein [Burkholderiales bacterium]
MKSLRLLPDVLGLQPGTVNVVLFSQAGCEFCAEVREHYLKPLLATRPRRVVIAEFELDGTRRLRDWSRRELTQADFARANRARFAPTLMFFGARGQTLAEPIVGMSRDFFGAYLDERIAAALRAAA